MSRDSILEETRAFLAQYIQDVDVDNDQDLFLSGLINSMFAMQLVLFVEKKYRFKVENEDLDYENFKSLNAISAFIERKNGAGPGKGP